MTNIRLNYMWHPPLLLSYCLSSIEMLPSHRLKERESTLTKLPSSQALLKDFQSGASTSSKIGRPSSQALPQLQALLASTLRTTQKDIQRRREQKDQHVEYEQQNWQAAPESDKLFQFHRKQDAKDNAQLVDGGDKVFIRLVDYDLVDGQLAYAAGGPPSKPHEWMVSNPLSPNPSTVAMQAQNGLG